MTGPSIRQRRRAAGFLVGLACGVLGVLLIAIIVRTFTVTDDIRAAQRDNSSAVAAIRDCTTEGGRCFEENARRTAAVVGDIGKLDIYSEACAAATEPDDPVVKRARLIEKCVRALLKADAPRSDGR
jgi:hypothetical protein